MEAGPTVIVKKGGFFASVARGVFGLLMTIVVCATGLGVYALHIVDARIDNFIMVGDAMARQVRHWRDIVPPAVSDAFSDRRADDYDENLVVETQFDATGGRHDRGRVIFRITNNGPETISLLALNVVLKDAAGLPLEDFRVYAATPLALGDDDWRGPLRRGHTREFACWAHGVEGDVSVSTEITELRVLAPIEPSGANVRVLGPAEPRAPGEEPVTAPSMERDALAQRSASESAAVGQAVRP